MTAANSYYFHRQNWSIDTNPPGYPISTFTALAMSAVLGLLFVVFLPVIGFVLAGQALAKKVWDLSKPLFQTSVAPLAAPGEAHLTGAPGKGHGDMMDRTLDEIAKEVQERRAKE